jgi:hypothetical protein
MPGTIGAERRCERGPGSLNGQLKGGFGPFTGSVRPTKLAAILPYITDCAAVIVFCFHMYFVFGFAYPNSNFKFKL